MFLYEFKSSIKFVVCREYSAIDTTFKILTLLFFLTKDLKKIRKELKINFGPRQI